MNKQEAKTFAKQYTIHDYGSGDIVVVIKKGRKKFMLPVWVSPYAFGCLNAYKWKWNNLTQSSPRIEELVVPDVDNTYIMSSHDVPEWARHLIESSYLRAKGVYEEIRFPVKEVVLRRLCDFYI